MASRVQNENAEERKGSEETQGTGKANAIELKSVRANLPEGTRLYAVAPCLPTREDRELQNELSYVF